MKTAFAVMLLFATALSLFLPVRKADAELSQQDREWISNLIDRKLEPIKLDIAEMKGKIEALEGKMATKDDIIAVQREVSSKFVAIIAALIGFWATLLAAIITIPYLYGRADRERVRQLEADIRELIKLKAEVETLKAIRETEERRREAAMRLAEEKPEFAEGFRRLGLI
jgi:outer membrane murein-binding lipoprotein Lpp